MLDKTTKEIVFEMIIVKIKLAKQGVQSSNVWWYKIKVQCDRCCIFNGIWKGNQCLSMLLNIYYVLLTVVDQVNDFQNDRVSGLRGDKTCASNNNLKYV